MARYTGPVCRQCRREGQKLFLKSTRCYTTKCPVERRPFPPGQHGNKGTGRRRVSNFGIQQREKQKARRIYGVLERQFRRYYQEASRTKGITGERLLQLLELRLDNVVYRLGLAGSRPEARQMVRHGHFTVNGRKVDIPSYQVREGEVIAVREKSRGLNRIKELVEGAGGRVVPAWLEFDPEKMSGRVMRLPTREEIDITVQEHLIVEMYSR
ncbi:MAG: 30S ribosomal protein S4 [Bacillota bacterium]